MKMEIKNLVFALSSLGLLISSYLLYSKITGNELVCGVSSCAVVNSGKYSVFLGIPVAAWGVIFYIEMMLMLALKQYRLFFAGSIMGVIFSAYLTYLEVFVIHAWCQWCVLSAWITLSLFIIGLRLMR